MANNTRLVIAVFDSEELADKAVTQVKEWDDAIGGVRLGAIGVLVKDSKGKIKTNKLGPRHTGAGLALGALAGLLTGGISVIGGLVIGGVAGHFVHSGLGLSKEDMARLNSELDGGKAAVAVVVEAGELDAVISWLKDLGGKTEAHAVTDEALQEAATASQAEQANPSASSEQSQAASDSQAKS